MRSTIPNKQETFLFEPEGYQAHRAMFFHLGKVVVGGGIKTGVLLILRGVLGEVLL